MSFLSGRKKSVKNVFKKIATGAAIVATGGAAAAPILINKRAQTARAKAAAGEDPRGLVATMARNRAAAGKPRGIVATIKARKAQTPEQRAEAKKANIKRISKGIARGAAIVATGGAAALPIAIKQRAKIARDVHARGGVPSGVVGKIAAKRAEEGKERGAFLNMKKNIEKARDARRVEEAAAIDARQREEEKAAAMIENIRNTAAENYFPEELDNTQEQEQGQRGANIPLIAAGAAAAAGVLFMAMRKGK